MKKTSVALLLFLLFTIPSFASETTFERNLSVNGHVDFTIYTGSGYIHLTKATGNAIHIIGHVKSHASDGESRVRQIVSQPSIEQTGNIVRIGAQRENLRNVSIDYDIQAPEDTFLRAQTGSGDITVASVGNDAKLSTGSGDIHATGLHNSFVLSTGSGSIYAEQIGHGNVKAETGSGNIELRNLNGSLRANSGSGDIRVGGQPTSIWHITTGSGSVDVWPAQAAAFTLNASTGSGTVHVDRQIATQGSASDHHHTTGKINGGGPLMQINTGSGDVRIH